MAKLMTAEEVVQEAAEDLTAQPGESAADLFEREDLQANLSLEEIAISDSTIASLTEDQIGNLKKWYESNAGSDLNTLPESLSGVLEWNESMTCLILKKQEESAEASTAEIKKSARELEENPQSNLKKRLEAIYEASAKANKLRDRLEDAESDTKAAKAHEKQCLEDLHQAEKELSRVIADAKTGQQKLPFPAESPAVVGESSTSIVSAGDGSETPPAAEPEDQPKTDSLPITEANTTPISELGVKSIKKLVGSEKFEAAKNTEDPIGLTDKQLEKLEAADWSTIGDLEKAMKEDDYWWKKLANDGHAQIVQRVISTLLAWRTANPAKAGE